MSHTRDAAGGAPTGFAPTGFAVVLFTRSLRLEDNSALNAAARAGRPILPVFVFTPEQADPAKNEHFSRAAFQYMVETLDELDDDIGRWGGGRLYTFAGDTIAVLESIRRKLGGGGGVAALYENLDVTPYARARSERLRAWAAEHGVEYVGVEDVDLVRMDQGRMAAGTMYSVFTAYWRNLVAHELPCLKPMTVATLKKKTAGGAGGGGGGGGGVWATPGALAANAGVVARMWRRAAVPARAPMVPADYVNPGGRREAVRRLEAYVAAGKVREYREARDFPARPATTRLSAALRFGVLSVREVAWAAAEAEGGRWDGGLIQELVWRSFYYHWMSERPALLETSFHAAYDGVPWRVTRETDAAFQRFARAETGFPIIDAGVRELVATGWSHNRIRMMLATFVVKGLRADWRIGERWMARLLRDHDVVSNTMGWQWGHSAAPSAQPYFRVMSPWAQGARFDADAAYIKRWVPELAAVAPRDIHRWNEAAVRARYDGGAEGGGVAYPAPMLDWKTAAAEAIEAYREAGRAAATAAAT